MRTRLVGSLICVGFMAGCLHDTETQEPDGDYSEESGETEDGLTDDEAALGAADPTKLIIGFNAGYADQFNYFADYYDEPMVPPGPRLCHAYVAWNVATKPAGSGSITDHSSPAFIEDWLRKAEGHCDEALISFKAMTHGPVPATATYAAVFEKFASTDWVSLTGFTGGLSYTPWNEPNNAADSGNGLGIIIPPRVAARYYLAAEKSCRKYNCKVAAGDFASNGNMWNDYEMNCLNDNVVPADLCKQKSPVNTSNRPASYLDVYKNEIVARATEFGLPASFRPAYFAFHGWHDTNRYIDAADHCSTYGTCTLRRILYSLRGSWGGIELWNTEDGVGQTSSPDDDAQGCAAAFLLRLQTISPRVKRLYITRLRSGPGELIRAGHVPRPALKLLQLRERTYANTSCR